MAGGGNRDDGPFEANEPASPPCLLHEIDPVYAGLVAAPPADVGQWRKVERDRLIAARLALAPAAREACAAVVSRYLDGLIADLAGPIVSVYWPFRGELDLRPWMTSLSGRGVRVALPVVTAKAHPLAFREWLPGAPMDRGVWNIPIPAADAASVVPTAVIAPLVGFDSAGYRLGYGGGFFDRTLAALSPRPLAIGVGYAIGKLPTIHPQPYDVPMDVIVTDAVTDRRV